MTGLGSWDQCGASATLVAVRRDGGSPAAPLEKLVATACEVTGARAGTLIVLDRAGAVGHTVTLGVTVERRRYGPDATSCGMLGVLVGEMRPRRVAALGPHAGLVTLPRHGGPAPFLGAPVTQGDRVLGALCLSGHAGRPFTEHDETLVALLATQAGLAIDNTLLVRDAQVGALALAGLREVADALLGGLTTDEALTLLVRRARELIGAGIGVVAVVRPGERALAVRVADGTCSEAVVAESLAFLAGDGVLVPVAGPTIVVPLRAGGRQLGTLCLADRQTPAPLSVEERLAVEAFAAEAAVLLRDRELRGELHKMSTLEERERIARDLHDDVVQTLFVAGLSLQAAELSTGPDQLRPRIADAVASIDRAIRDLRHYIFGLDPGDRSEPDLGRGLRDLADTFRLASGVPTTVVVCPAASRLLVRRVADVLHFAREAVSNAVRHAGATEVRVSLSLDGATACLRVTDDGTGFDVDHNPGTGRGLVNLRARAAMLGGTMELDSSPGRGTSVSLRVAKDALRAGGRAIIPNAAVPGRPTHLKAVLCL